MRSEPLLFELQLNDEYEEAEYRAANPGANTFFAVNGKLRRDAAIFLELMAEESATGNVAVMCHAGSGSATVQSLMQAEGNAALVPLYLNAFMDPQTQQPMLKGRLSVTAQFHDKRATAEFVHSKAPRTRFELSGENLGTLTSLMQSEIMGQLTPFMDSAKAENVQFKETMPPNARIISPWRMTSIGQIWSPSYFADDRAGGVRLRSDAEPDEKAMLDVIHYAMRRHNWEPDEAFGILQSQMRRTDATYDDRVTEITAALGTAFMLFPNSLPYKSDTRDLNMRSAALQRSDVKGNVDVESYDDTAYRLGDDCEGLGLQGKRFADQLAREQWKHEHMRIASEFVRTYYVATSNLGSVTSPKMDQKHTASRLDTAHDVERIRAHLDDAERHHEQIETFAAAGAAEEHIPKLSVGDSVADKHKYVQVYPPPKEPLGGHSWVQFVPTWSFAEQVRRVVRDVDVHAVFGTESLPAWSKYLPEMVGEGTATVYPLLKPIVEYTVNGDRNEVRRAELAYQRSLHAIVSQSKAFHAMTSEMRQAKTAHVPNTRHTGFYRQTTQVFADKYLNETGGVASYSAVRTHAVDAQSVRDDHDPLRDRKYAALTSASVHKRTAEMHLELQEAAMAANSKKPTRAGGAFVHVTGEARKYAAALPRDVEEEMVLGDLVGVKTLATSSAHDAANLVRAKDLSLGVDMEERLEFPLSNRIALSPNARLTKTGAYVLRAYMRCLPASVQFSKQLPLLQTSFDRKVAFVRLAADGKTVRSSETARLVEHDEAVDAQRSYVRRIATQTKQMFAQRPWLSREEAKEQGLSLVTFLFKPYDLVSAEVGEHIMRDLLQFKNTGLVHTADFYVEEPTQHIQNAVFRLLCRAPAPK